MTFFFPPFCNACGNEDMGEGESYKVATTFIHFVSKFYPAC